MPFQFKSIPSPFPEMRMWACIAHGHSFVISEEDGRFTASAKCGPSTPGDGKRIDLGGLDAHATWDEAQQACVNFIYG